MFRLFLYFSRPLLGLKHATLALVPVEGQENCLFEESGRIGSGGRGGGRWEMEE